MSSGALKKPPAQASAAGRSSTSNTPGASGSSRSPSRASAPSSPPANGVARSGSRRGANGSPVSARAAVKRPAAPSGLSNSSTPTVNPEDEDARIENAALVDDLKERLQKAESSADEFQKQIEVLQARLDESNKEHLGLEERMHEEEEKMEALANENRESLRQRRELEGIYEAERVSAMKDKEESQAREDELHDVIRRLKDNLSQRDTRPGVDEEGRLPRQSSFPSPTEGHFAPTSSLQRSNSRSNSKLILQKDKVIESLRLELAEAQIKLAELGNMDGTHITELEGKLMETRMANARLMEENESFQVLLSEKTLNGDFSAGPMRRVSAEERRTPSRDGHAGTSLADELEQSSPGSGDYESDHVRRLEADLVRSKEENKALSLYINRIIERLLQHQGFESVLSNTQEGPHGSGNAADKDLPPIPPPKDTEPPEQQQSFLQRARSVISKDGGATKPKRPISTMPQQAAPSAHENPNTAPSIPLQRSGSAAGNKRMSMPVSTRSISNSSGTIPGAAGIVNNMYKPPPSEQISPSLASPTRGSFFGLNMPGSSQPSNPQRMPSGSQVATSHEDIPEEPLSASLDAREARDAAMDALTGGSSGDASDAPSPPRSISSGLSAEARQQREREQNVMAGRQIKPLRLVQKNPEAAAAEEARQKAANRASWFGGVSNFFSKAGQAALQENQQPQAYVQGQAVQGADRDSSRERPMTMGPGDRKVSWNDTVREE